MATNFGGISCDFVKGIGARSLADLKTVVSVFRMPGLDGFGAHNFSRGASSYRYQCVKYGTEGAVETFIADLEALQGSVVSAEDDHGRTYTLLLVVSVAPPIKHAAWNPGTLGTHRANVVVSGVRLQG